MHWQTQLKIVEKIKEKCFKTGAFGTDNLDRENTLGAKVTDESFDGINEEHFLCLFKRAASEYILDLDLLLSKELKKKKSKKKRANTTTAPKEMTDPRSSPKQTAAPKEKTDPRSSPKQTAAPKPKKPSNTAPSKTNRKMSLTKNVDKPIEVTLPFVQSSWSDGENNRTHVFVHMLSGTTVKSFVGEPKLMNDGKSNVILFRMTLNLIMLDDERIFSHPWFDSDYYNPNYPKMSSVSTYINKLMEGKDLAEIVVKIPLPADGPYVFTPEKISGHLSFVPIEVPEKDSERGETGEKVFVLMMDLMKKRSRPSFKAKRKKSPVKNNYLVG